MRNLKRALSLALASIMLLGMMVTGAGAASSSFTDFDQIVNQEAAEVTSGLKIFDGYTDGTFGPENVVTRAEMAVIICKILNGSDVDPGNFTDIDTFDDVPAWAEGYVNYCASMGIVVGVGERKFNPNATVSTVEAATMLLKALGYFIEEDQLGADWKTVVTGRATALKLYGDLTLGVDEGLTRDNVAELLFHTLFAQRVAYDDNRNLYVKNTDRDVVVTNGTVDKNNTFAMNTFGMWYVDGVVTANSYTLDSLSETVNNAPRTSVLFDTAADMGQGVVASYPFEYTTGLDMIGHAARVYYSIERRAPVVYAIVDRATKVEYITYNSNTTNLANAANEAGFRRNTILEVGQANWKVNYSWDHTVGSLDDQNVNTWGAGEVKLDGPHINKTLLVISNDSDYKVNTVIVLDQYLDTVRRAVEGTDGKTEYRLTTHDGDDQNIPHGTFAVNDYVVVTDIGNQGKMLNFAAPEKVTASISKITGESDGDGTVKKIIADGTEYTGSPVAHHESAKQKLDTSRSLENTTNFESIQTIGETTLLLDFQGKCIGIAEEEVATNYAYAAQFGVTHDNGSLNLDTAYALTVKLYFIDGTSGVYRVNTTDGSNNTFKGLVTSKHGDELYARAVAKLLNDGYDSANGSVLGTDYPYENVTEATKKNGAQYDPKDTYPAGIGVSAVDDGTKGQLTGIIDDTTTGLGVYKVSVRSNNTVVMTALEYDETAAVNQSGTRLITGHSTFVKANGQNVVQSAAHEGRNMYQTSKTVYFYVDGDFHNGGLSVGTKTGINNAVSIAAGGNKDNNANPESFEQVFVTCKNHNNHANGERDTVEAVMIYGYDMGNDDTLYFYKQGNYHLEEQTASRAGKRVSVTFDMFDADGEVYSVNYNNGGSYYEIDVARQMVEDKNTGYYEIGSDNLVEKFVVNRDGENKNGNQQNCLYNVRLTDSPKGGGNPKTGVLGELDGAKNVYILNADAYHNEFEENIFTAIDTVGGISADTLVVDTTGNGIDSVRTIADKCDANNTVRVSYTYKTEGDKAYQVKVIFVTDYQPKPIDGGSNNDAPEFNRVTWNGSTLTVNYHNNDFPIDANYIENWVETNFNRPVKTVNTLNKMIVFEDGNLLPMMYTTKQWFKVTNATTGIYDYYEGTDQTIPADELGIVEDAWYVINDVVGTGEQEDGGVDLGKTLATFDADVTIYEGYSVDASTVDTVKVGAKPVADGQYVAAGETITVTKAGDNQKITATMATTPDATIVSGASPLNVVMQGNVSFVVAQGYVITAKSGVEIRYTDEDGNAKTIQGTDAGASVVLESGDEYTVLYTDGLNQFVKTTDSSGDTFAVAASADATVSKDLTYEAGYVKVVGITSDTAATHFVGVEKDKNNVYAVKKTQKIEKASDNTANKGTYYSLDGTTFIAYAENKTYGDLTPTAGVLDFTTGKAGLNYVKANVELADALQTDWAVKGEYFIKAATAQDLTVVLTNTKSLADSKTVDAANTKFNIAEGLTVASKAVDASSAYDNTKFELSLVLYKSGAQLDASGATGDIKVTIEAIAFS